MGSTRGASISVVLPLTNFHQHNYLGSVALSSVLKLGRTSVAERPKRRGRAIGVLALAAFIAIGIPAAGLPLYVFPAAGELSGRVDAVVVLGPAHGGRVEFAKALVDDGLAGVFVVSRDPSNPASASEADVCADVAVICFSPAPPTTRGEAAEVNLLAREHGWTRIAVITGTSHVTRARYIFDTCSTVAATVLEAPEPQRTLIGWARQYLYQSGAFVKAALVGCVD